MNLTYNYPQQRAPYYYSSTQPNTRRSSPTSPRSKRARTYTYLPDHSGVRREHSSSSNYYVDTRTTSPQGWQTSYTQSGHQTPRYPRSILKTPTGRRSSLWRSSDAPPKRKTAKKSWIWKLFRIFRRKRTDEGWVPEKNKGVRRVQSLSAPARAPILPPPVRLMAAPPPPPPPKQYHHIRAQTATAGRASQPPKPVQRSGSERERYYYSRPTLPTYEYDTVPIVAPGAPRMRTSPLPPANVPLPPAPLPPPPRTRRSAR